LNDRDNKLFGGVIGGAGVTVRTDVVDITVQAQVSVGLTKLDKEATERQTPILAEIPLIIRFFRPKERQKDRDNLIILIKPTIVKEAE
jgi:type II secretory pathway component HofQ